MTQKIAFIGLGAMGLPMAKNLVKQQYPVTGFDLREAPLQALEAAGGSRAASVAEAAAGADVLMAMVLNAEQAEAVLFDAGGLDTLDAKACVIVMSTCGPDRIAAMAERVEASGRQFIDAPVSGGVVGAQAGNLTIMAAGKQAAFDRVQPLLSVLGGANLHHLGQAPGQGASMKIVNQLLCGVHIAVAAEALAFAERSEIDPAAALRIVADSAASSWMLKQRGPRMVADDGNVTSAVDIFVKDLSLVLDAGRATKMGLPLAAAAHQLFLAASGLGSGAKDDSQVIDVYRALAAGHDRQS